MDVRAWFAAIGSGPAPRRRIAWLGAVVIAAIVVLAAHDIVRGYQASVDETRRELETQSRVIAEQTARSVQAVDVVLRHLAEQLGGGALERAADDELHAYLKEQAVGLVQSDGLAVIRADGSVRAVSQAPPARVPPLNLAADPPFARLRDEPQTGLRIADAVISPGTGQWVFPMGRRLLTRDGRFAGVVGAPGRVGYFQQFYRDAYPDPSTRIALLQRNGTLLARHPPADAMLGKRLPALEPLLPSVGAGSVVTRGASPIDGVDRFASIRLVPEYPLVVVVTRDAAAALAPWRTQAVGSALRTLGLAAIASWLLVMVLRQFERLDKARASLEVSQERYALAAAGSDDGIWDWDLQAGTAYESRRARELQGLPLQPETQPIGELRAQLTYHPDDAHLRASAMQAHLDGDAPAYEVDYRVRRDGEYRWIHVRALCTRDAAGRPVRLAGSVSDIDARKRAEVALRESEERYALAMTGSNEGHWLWDIPARRIYVSATLAELFGLAGGAQTMADDAYFSRLPLHPEDRERVHRNRNEHLAGRTPRLDHEFRIVVPGTGEVRWIHTRAQCFRDADGEPLRMAGSTVDATRRKRAELALRESEDRFADAVAGSDDGIWVWDYVTGQAFASRRARDIIGLPEGPELQSIDEWYAQMERVLHPDDLARRRAAIDAHVGGAVPAYEGEYRVRAADGGYRWLRVRGMCVRDAAGRPLRFAGSVSDIDARKRAEEALRTSEERYQLAVAGSNEGLWDWDLNTDMLFLSARAQRLVLAEAGEPLRPREEWIARTVYHPDDLGTVRQALGAHLRGDTPHFSVEYRVQHHSGTWHWYRQRGIAVRDANGRPYRMAGSMEDISVRKHAEAERERLERQLRQAQKLEAIGTLAGGIAHDFNNILSAILGYGEMVQREVGDGTPTRRHIDACVNAGLRAKSLVERILAFSRSGTGERVTVPVQSVVAEALDSIAGSLPAEVRLQHDLRADDAGVLGDATQIHQVVMNLCANAAHAMRADARRDAPRAADGAPPGPADASAHAPQLAVSLDAPTLDAPLIVATCTLPAGRYVRLRVADTGCGIEPQVLERIFDPFFTTKAVGVGTGLGLSLVHGIVSDLDGGIAVDSVVGQGTTFSVYLPWQSYRPPDAPAADERIEPGNGETLLLVDDEEALVQLGEEALAELGYEPVGFTSAAAALEAFRADPQRFDAVLSDESMPGMTGSELAAEIRRLRPDVPVVLMTGFVNAAISERAREAGVADVLVKPLAARDIARCLAALFRRERSADDVAAPAA